MKTRILSGLLCAALMLTLAPAALAASGTSTPVSEAAQVINALDIMVGDGSGDLQLGRLVNRAEFITMAVKASPVADQVGQASTSPFPDVPYTHWAAGYVQVGVSQGYIAGYLDGTFRPDNTITLAEGATIVLNLLGYTGSDFSGAYPTGQLALFRSLDLDTDLTATAANDTLTRQDAMYMFYNMLTAPTKSGTIYLNQLGYSTTASGEIDRVSLINQTMKGPVVVSTGWQSQVPFDVSGATVYRAGERTNLSAIQTNDVVYWSSPMRTLWVYRDKVTGTIQDLAPSASSPTSVTVAGNSYTIETAAAAYDLSDLGTWHLGDVVTLLLGRDGGVAAVAGPGAADTDTARVGLITQLSTGTYTDSNGNQYTADTVTLLATDGQEYRYESQSVRHLAVGDLVEVLVTDGEISIKHANSDDLSGRVSSDGSTLGRYTLADDVEILDTYGENGGLRVYPSRLAGMTLSKDEVGYYSLNGQGQIDRLVLVEATGDGYHYGILTDLTDNSQNMNIMVTYEMDVRGQPVVLTSTTVRYPVSEGPIQIRGSLTDVDRIYNLSRVDVSRLTSGAAYSGNQSYTLWDDVIVYEYRDGSYYLSSLDRVIDGDFTVTAWYDQPMSAGGRVRVIVAR